MAVFSPASPASPASGGGPTECAMGWSFFPHRHVWVRTTSTYYGYYYYSTSHSCIGPCTISYTETHSTSNTWGASISFASPPVSGGLHYDVTHTESYSFTVSFPNNKVGVNKQVWYKDGYDVSNGDVKTDFYYDQFLWVYCCTTTGTGWGARFDNRSFYTQTI